MDKIWRECQSRRWVLVVPVRQLAHSGVGRWVGPTNYVRWWDQPIARAKNSYFWTLSCILLSSIGTFMILGPQGGWGRPTNCVRWWDQPMSAWDDSSRQKSYFWLCLAFFLKASGQDHCSALYWNIYDMVRLALNQEGFGSLDLPCACMM